MVLFKNIVIATLGLTLALILYTFAKQGTLGHPASSTTTPAVATSTKAEPALVTYNNATAGITFSYPQEYVMNEADLSDAYQRHSSITLTRASDATTTENGEGPTGITIDIYQNGKNDSLNQWMAASSSNYYLARGTFASTTIAGEAGVQYAWSGLYEGETSAFLHRGNIIAISVTYISPEDENVAIYRQLLQTLELQ